ncbi:uncharacterized protein LOC124366144 isoform X1 [Homalodisca vitripennis]|uniref:uncharacterized protein LOC124366144 isoform X1 n=2 Tax=Homalodisca vitripennis TaxID=197043 RepID=UPI001EEB11D4|nr:uncharacterized protein LOC124366144 isoform X1 [Homalodisca vitripennis]
MPVLIPKTVMMGRNEDQLPPSEALPGIGEHPVVFHNGTGFFYICREYASELDKRLFECIQPECRVTAGMGEGTGSPLIDVGRHSHPPDLTYREKCLLLHNIRQRLRLQEIPASEILRDSLSLLEKDNIASPSSIHEPDTFEEPITKDFQIVKMESNLNLDDVNEDYDSSSKISDSEEHHTQVFHTKPEPITTLYLPEENMMETAGLINENFPEVEVKEVDVDIEDCNLPSRRAMIREMKRENLRKAQQSLARKQDNSFTRIKRMPFYKPKLKYTEEAVIKAIKAVENGSTFRAASKKFNIPDSTLRDKYYGRSPMETTEDCRTSIPTVEKEKMIAERVRTMMQDGFPVSRQQLLAIACDTLNTPSTKRCTKDNYAPNMKWIAGFLQRHPEISDLMEYSQAVSERNIFEVDGNVVIEVVDDDDKTIASRSSTLRSCVRRESSRSVITWTSPPISLGGEDNLKRKVPKRRKRTRRQYTSEDLNRAIQAIRCGAFNVATAARLFGIPQTTLNDKTKKSRQWLRRKMLQASVKKETEKSIYSDDKFKEAIQAVKSGKSVHLAVQECGIPFSSPRIEMVGSYNHSNKRPGNYKTYTNEDVDQAIKAIKEGSTCTQAAKTFGLPRSTLQDKFNQKYNLTHAFSVTCEDEKTIIEKFESISQEGFPISEQQLVSIAVNTLNSKHRESSTPPIKHDMKLDFWLANFLSRHPEIKERLSLAPPTEDQLLSWLCDDDNKYL